MCTLHSEAQQICTPVGHQPKEGGEAQEVPPQRNSSRRAVQTSDFRNARKNLRGSRHHAGHAGLQNADGPRAGKDGHEAGPRCHAREGERAGGENYDCLGATSKRQGKSRPSRRNRTSHPPNGCDSLRRLDLIVSVVFGTQFDFIWHTI